MLEGRSADYGVVPAKGGARGGRCRRAERLATTFLLLLSLLIGASASADPARAAIQIERFEFASTEADGTPSAMAGAHPYEVRTALVFGGDDGHGGPVSPHNLVVDLPPGLTGNPTATPACGELVFQLDQCSPDSQIGYVRLKHSQEVSLLPLFNLEPLLGVAGEFGFQVGSPVRLSIGVRTGGDYGISITTRNLSQALVLEEAEIILWGIPADPRHDELRGQCLSQEEPAGDLCPSEAPLRPLLSNPSNCLAALAVTVRVDSWQDPGIFASATSSNEDLAGDPVGIGGCQDLAFHPTLSISPSLPSADSPSGLTLELRSPQSQDPGSPSEATLEKAALTLPKGLALSPSGAAGLGACSPEEIRLEDAGEPSCPDDSKLGLVTIETSFLDAPLSGSLYLATPEDNPFGTRFAVYAVATGNGVLVKLAGRVDPDPDTGQLRVRFEDSPQLPFSEVKIRLFDGTRAALRTPPRCGTYTTRSELTGWGAAAAVTPSTSFDLSSGCPGERFEPVLSAASLDPAAGSYTPFALRLRRGESDSDFASLLSLKLPPGISAALRGTTLCTDSALDAAGPLPGCPASSGIGSATIRAGAGPSPLVLTGEVYLSGPYKGAPFSLAAIVPARAGPFDLGTIVERIAVDVASRTAQLSLRADPLPQIRGGVPLELRSITLELDRPRFIHNPTSCGAAAVTGTATTGDGQSSALTAPLGVGGCAALPFKPRLSLSLGGALGRNGHPVLRAVMRAAGHEAGIAAATIVLPPGELLDLRRVGVLCARQLPADQCPPSSRVGGARVSTPLLAVPLRGSIYLRRPSGRLPDLIADLRGGGLHILLHGRAIARGGRLGIRLQDLPDVPFSMAAIRIGSGILVNSEALCRRPRRGRASLTAHDGALRDLRPPLRLRAGC